MAQIIFRFSIFLSIIMLTILMMVSKSTSAPNFISTICSNETMFRHNSPYQDNLNNLFRYLSINATNPNGYSQAISSDASDTIYGHFLCRGDRDVSSCQDCVLSATITDLAWKYCPNRKDAIIWYYECMVRYSNQSFFGKLDDSTWINLMNTQNVTGNVTSFTEAMKNMMINRVAVRAALGGSHKKLATDFVNYTKFQPIYGLGQCTPDLSSSDCHKCLVGAIGKFKESRGGTILQPSCFVRYEIYPFFDLSSLPQPPTIAAIVDASSSHSRRKHIVLLVASSTSAAVSILLLCGVWICIRKRKIIQTSNLEISEIKREALDSLQFELNTIRLATNNFSTKNKLGEGGFGEVYKGVLENGQEIAVKRLSKNSGQGEVEFKTEVGLVAKLRHKNLVKLLGFCVAFEEKILVYEFLPKSSLDRLLFGNIYLDQVIYKIQKTLFSYVHEQSIDTFDSVYDGIEDIDPTREVSLDWQTRFKIIVGIARGLLYLHEDSPLKVIHRDLKSSNILLDENLNPKIADFGLAKLFGVDQTQGDTRRIVGTYGYMAPEYAITGHFSVKSDVYSFGVLVLEIVTSQRSRFHGQSQHEEALLHRAWRLWNEDKPLDLVDTTLSNNFPTEEVTKCINIGLLCIQEDAVVRPRMTSIVAALNGQANSLPVPNPPSFFGITNNTEMHNAYGVYTGTMTITDLYPRN